MHYAWLEAVINSIQIGNLWIIEYWILKIDSIFNFFIFKKLKIISIFNFANNWKLKINPIFNVAKIMKIKNWKLNQFSIPNI